MINTIVDKIVRSSPYTSRLIILVLYAVIGVIIFRKPFEIGNGAKPMWTMLLVGSICSVIIASLILHNPSSNTQSPSFIAFGAAFGATGVVVCVLSFIFYTLGARKKETGIANLILYGFLPITALVVLAIKKISIANMMGKSLSWFNFTRILSGTWYDIKRFILIQRTGTDMWIKMIIVVELLVIAGYFAVPTVYRTLAYRKGTVLLESKPISLGISKVFVVNHDPDNDTDKIIYNYSISAWFYMEPGGHKKIKLLNFASRPKIVYNQESTNIEIQIYEDDGADIVVAKFVVAEFPLQKWNHVLVNYDGGTLDIFLNNKLVFSRLAIDDSRIAIKEREDEYENKNHITVGEDDKDIRGGVKDVVFFNKINSRRDITRLFNNSIV